MNISRISRSIILVVRVNFMHCPWPPQAEHSYYYNNILFSSLLFGDYFLTEGYGSKIVNGLICNATSNENKLKINYV